MDRDMVPARKAQKATKNQRSVAARPEIRNGRYGAADAAKNRKPSVAIFATRPPAANAHTHMGVPPRSQRRKPIKPPR